jgi:hypothetical protein
MAITGSYSLAGLVGSPSLQVIDELSADMDIATRIAHELCESFSAVQPHFLYLESYYTGNPPLAREPDRLSHEYRELLLMGRSNWCGVICDVVNERLRVTSCVSTAEPTQDPVLWDWWNRSNMDGVAAQIHLTSLKFGICYVSTWPGDDGVPRIMGESPLATYVRFDPETGVAVAAIRLWKDCCDDRVYCDLTTPVAQYRLVSQGALTTKIRDVGEGMPRHMLLIDPATIEWSFRDPIDVVPIRRNLTGVVPYVAIYNQPDLLGGYRGEFETVIPIQDRINKTTFDRLVTQEFAAFPQRAIAGIETFRDPVTGEVKLPFDAAVDRVWTATDPNTKFTQFDASSGQGYLDAVTADIQALASESRTPPHFIVAGMGTFPSGEALRATEFGLTRKVQARQQSYGDGWANILRLAAVMAGDETLADDTGVGVLWADMEARSEGEVVDALLKMGTLGVPWPALWARWGAGPEEIAAWEAKLDDTLKRAQLYTQATGTPTQAQLSQQVKAAAVVNSEKVLPGDADADTATPV